MAIRETVNAASTTKYLHQDHLGSTDVITNASGQVQERSSFDAYGSRRVATTWRDPVGALTSLFTTRGYTGHEQLDDVGLIHMNGRVYDPALGRFLSADPLIGAPANPQNLNRYSYVNNNPLSYTDPSGFFLKKLWKGVKKLFKNEVFRAVVAIAASVFTLGYTALLTGNIYAASAAAGFVGGAISTGTLKGGLIGAASALMFAPLHGLSSGLGKTLAHGAVGGLRSRLLGGSFRVGFLSAGFTQSLSGRIGRFESFDGRIVAAAVAGGAAAELGGGKFANGAVTGAFSRLFNDENLDREKQLKVAASVRMGKMLNSLSNEEFKTLMDAAGPENAPNMSIDQRRMLLNLSLNEIIIDNTSSLVSGAVAGGLNSSIQYGLETVLPGRLGNVITIYDYVKDLRSDVPQPDPRVGVWCDKTGCAFGR